MFLVGTVAYIPKVSVQGFLFQRATFSSYNAVVSLVLSSLRPSGRQETWQDVQPVLKHVALLKISRRAWGANRGRNQNSIAVLPSPKMPKYLAHWPLLSWRRRDSLFNTLSNFWPQSLSELRNWGNTLMKVNPCTASRISTTVNLLVPIIWYNTIRI